MTDVYINEKFIGTIDNHKDLIKFIRNERRTGKLPTELNFYHDEDFDELHIDVTRGRARRPLIVF